MNNDTVQIEKMREDIKLQEKALRESKTRLKDAIREKECRQFHESLQEQGAIQFKPRDIVQFIERGEVQERTVYEVNDAQDVLVVSQRVYASIVDVREHSVEVSMSECLKVGEEESPKRIERKADSDDEEGCIFYPPYLSVEKIEINPEAVNWSHK